MAGPDYERLRERLFSVPVRCGWEYLPPPAVAAFDVPPPEADEIRPPDLSGAFLRQAAWQQAHKGRRALIAIVLLVLSGTSVVFLLLAIAYSAWAFGPILYATYEIADERTALERNQKAEQARVAAQGRQWVAARTAFDARQQQLVAQSPTWYPVAPAEGRSRVDVFGGRLGWSELITTFASAGLTRGGSLFVLDLTGDNVASGLVRLAADQELPVQERLLPGSCADISLLDDIESDQLAGLLFDAVRDVGEHRGDLAPHHVEYLRMVIDRLDPPADIARIVAGLQVLRGTDDPDDTPLSDPELLRISSRIEIVASDPAAAGRLDLLIHKLQELAELGRRPDSERVTLADPGLGVLAVAPSLVDGEYRFTRRLTVLWLIHQLSRTGSGGPDWVVVAEADHVGRDTLELLAKTAARAGIRLMLLFEHLRDETTALLGGSDSATVFMRLGSFEEANRAAHQIGRGHRFTLSSLTQWSSTPEPGGQPAALAETEAWRDRGAPGGPSWSRGLSKAREWSASSARVARATGAEAVSTQRSHGFTVEPTVLQNLQRTAFLLLDDTPGQRSVVAGDCYPGIATLPRVAVTSAPPDRLSLVRAAPEARPVTADQSKRR